MSEATSGNVRRLNELLISAVDAAVYGLEGHA